MTDKIDLMTISKRLDQHIKDFNDHVENEDSRWDHLIKLQEQNAEAIYKLTESTQGLVEAWDATNGAIKVGKALASFVKWATSIAIIGGVITWFLDKH